MHDCCNRASSECANGETAAGAADNGVLVAIPCQAEGSDEGTSEGVETRVVSNASDNRPHERPAAARAAEDIVRSSEKSEQQVETLRRHSG